MRYTVLWTVTAERSLADIWLNAQDRQLVADAANSIDHQLRYDAEERGESRESGRRILLAAPLGVKFRVVSDDRIVRVLHVWRFEQPEHGS